MLLLIAIFFYLLFTSSILSEKDCIALFSLPSLLYSFPTICVGPVSCLLISPGVLVSHWSWEWRSSPGLLCPAFIKNLDPSLSSFSLLALRMVVPTHLLNKQILFFPLSLLSNDQMISFSHYLIYQAWWDLPLRGLFVPVYQAWWDLLLRGLFVPSPILLVCRGRGFEMGPQPFPVLPWAYLLYH